MKSVAIIGAGITGLSAAFELQKNGVPATIYEAGSRAGGVIQSIRQDGFLAECGPNTLLETSPRIPELFEELGITSEAVHSDAAAKNKYIICGGLPVAMPTSAAEFVKTPLFSAGAKLRLLREPFVSRCAPEFEESLAAFVVRRLGREFLDYAINPFVAGVYAGDPWKLSVREAFGKVYQLEQRYGSLIGGQLLGARERAKRKTVSKQNAPKISFKGGLSTLTNSLATRLGESLRFGHALAGIERSTKGWKLHLVTTESSQIEEHSAVLVTTPAYKLAKIPLRTELPASFKFLEQISYAPVSSVVLGFRREDVKHPLDGFGFLVPEVEGLSILGAIFSSSLFPNRAPDGCVTITCYLGGVRAPELPSLPVEAQTALVLEDLVKTLGVCGKPVFRHHAVYSKAIPQYELGYSEVRRQIEALELKCPGLFLGGNYHNGVSLSDSLLNGLALGNRIADYFQHLPAPDLELAVA